MNCNEHIEKTRVNKIMKDFKLRIDSERYQEPKNQIDDALSKNNYGEEEDSLEQRLHIKRIE